MSLMMELEKLKKKIRVFVEEREWERFQTPKNISMALAIEASELMEIFQWLTDQEAIEIKTDNKKMGEIRDEVADILYWLIRLSDLLDIDLSQAALEKLKKNEQKYPVSLSKGNAKKYTEL